VIQNREKNPIFILVGAADKQKNDQPLWGRGWFLRNIDGTKYIMSEGNNH